MSLTCAAHRAAVAGRFLGVEQLAPLPLDRVGMVRLACLVAGDVLTRAAPLTECQPLFELPLQCRLERFDNLVGQRQF